MTIQPQEHYDLMVRILDLERNYSGKPGEAQQIADLKELHERRAIDARFDRFGRDMQDAVRDVVGRIK